MQAVVLLDTIGVETRCSSPKEILTGGFRRTIASRSWSMLAWLAITCAHGEDGTASASWSFSMRTLDHSWRPGAAVYKVDDRLLHRPSSSFSR